MSRRFMGYVPSLKGEGATGTPATGDRCAPLRGFFCMREDYRRELEAEDEHYERQAKWIGGGEP